MFQYLLATNSIDIVAEDFNYDLLKESQNKFLDNFIEHVQMVNKPTHIFNRSCLYQERFDERIYH